MRAFFAILSAALLALSLSTALAAPELSGMVAGDNALIAGEDGWYVEFETTEGGSLAMQLLGGATGEPIADIGSVWVEAGSCRVSWNGLLPDGAAVAPGAYMVALRLRNYWGEESNECYVSLQVLGEAQDGDAAMLAPAQEGDDAQESALTQAEMAAGDAAIEDAVAIEEAGDAGEQSAATVAQRKPAPQEVPVPQATSFWDMDPDAYDLTDPEHQQAIWDLMMQPITVLNVGQTEHVYPTNLPGISRTPYKENTAGELHGQSQGVHVLEEYLDGDGYLLIEAY